MAAIYSICVALLITKIACVCHPPKYFIPRAVGTRFQAFQNCKLNDANLVSIENKAQADQLFATLLEIAEKHTLYWISGFSYWKASQSNWWFDGTGAQVTYSGWCSHQHQPEEPNGSVTYSEPCIALNYEGDSACWHDYPCFTVKQYICVQTCKKEAKPPFAYFGQFCAFYDLQNQVNAQTACENKKRGLNLISVESYAKLQKVLWYTEFYAIPGYRFWTGLKRKGNYTEEWVWKSGKGDVAKWINWHGYRHQDPANNCAIMEKVNKTFVMLAYPCDPYLKYFYLCE